MTKKAVMNGTAQGIGHDMTVPTHQHVPEPYKRLFGAAYACIWIALGRKRKKRSKGLQGGRYFPYLAGKGGGWGGGTVPGRRREAQYAIEHRKLPPQLIQGVQSDNRSIQSERLKGCESDAPKEIPSFQIPDECQFTGHSSLGGHGT